MYIPLVQKTNNQFFVFNKSFLAIIFDVVLLKLIKLFLSGQKVVFQLLLKIIFQLGVGLQAFTVAAFLWVFYSTLVLIYQSSFLRFLTDPISVGQCLQCFKALVLNQIKIIRLFL